VQSLEWVFGFNKNVIGGLHSLVDATRDVRSWLQLLSAVFHCTHGVCFPAQ
jgi:hypothetical protein